MTPPADLVRDLAPSGVLRASINLGNPVLAQGTPDDPSGVTEHERGAHVLMIEGILESQGGWLVARDQLLNALVQLGETLCERGLAREASSRAYHR